MRITAKEIRKIIFEQLEDLYVMDNAANVTRLSRDSADDQIDSLILKFETDSIKGADESMFESSLANFSLLDIISEQVDEEEEEAEAEDIEQAEEEEVEIDEPADSKDIDVEEPAESLRKPKLNIDSFSKRIARLALNHDSLLDVPTVVINRAVTFLEENYDQEHIDQMIDILNNQFDFNLGKEREENERAVAIGAFGGSDGGGSPAASE
tara:strand:+ start:731 stop:1360 length:630 start_codon:yes stop_codon:yes gene_type:complete